MWFPGKRHFVEALSLGVIHSYQKDRVEYIVPSIYDNRGTNETLGCDHRGKEGGQSSETTLFSDQKL